jgi:hypothetical protein
MIDWIKTVRGRRVRQKAAAYPEYVALLRAAARSAARSNGATSAPTASCWINRGASTPS